MIVILLTERKTLFVTIKNLLNCQATQQHKNTVSCKWLTDKLNYSKVI